MSRFSRLFGLSDGEEEEVPVKKRHEVVHRKPPGFEEYLSKKKKLDEERDSTLVVAVVGDPDSGTGHIINSFCMQDTYYTPHTYKVFPMNTEATKSVCTTRIISWPSRTDKFVLRIDLVPMETFKRRLKINDKEAVSFRDKVRIFLIDRLRDRFGARGMFEHFIVFDEEFTDVGKFIVFRDNVYDAVGFEIPKDFVAAFDFTIISDFPNLAMHKIEMTESPDEAIVTDLIGTSGALFAVTHNERLGEGTVNLIARSTVNAAPALLVVYNTTISKEVHRRTDDTRKLRELIGQMATISSSKLLPAIHRQASSIHFVDEADRDPLEHYDANEGDVLKRVRSLIKEERQRALQTEFVMQLSPDDQILAGGLLPKEHSDPAFLSTESVEFKGVNLELNSVKRKGEPAAPRIHHLVCRDELLDLPDSPVLDVIVSGTSFYGSERLKNFNFGDRRALYVVQETGKLVNEDLLNKLKDTPSFMVIVVQTNPKFKTHQSPNVFNMRVVQNHPSATTTNEAILRFHTLFSKINQGHAALQNFVVLDGSVQSMEMLIGPHFKHKPCDLPASLRLTVDRLETACAPLETPVGSELQMINAIKKRQVPRLTERQRELFVSVKERVMTSPDPEWNVFVWVICGKDRIGVVVYRMQGLADYHITKDLESSRPESSFSKVHSKFTETMTNKNGRSAWYLSALACAFH